MPIPKVTVADVKFMREKLISQCTDEEVGDWLNQVLQQRAEDKARADHRKIRPNCF